jgi:hypothetical protein
MSSSDIPTVDIINNARPNGTLNDIGAYEWSSSNTFVLSYPTVGATLSQNFDILTTLGTKTLYTNSTGNAIATALGPWNLAESTIYNKSELTGWQTYKTEGSLAAGGTVEVGYGAGGNGTANFYYLGNANTAGADQSLGGNFGTAFTGGYGVVLQNNTGTDLTSFSLSYTGEQWKKTASEQTLSFKYAIGTAATIKDISNGSYTAVSLLNFVTPNTDNSTTPDGNAAGFRTAKVYTVSGISWPNGQRLALRWDCSAGELSIDDVSFTTAIPTISVSTNSLTGFSATYGAGASSVKTFTVGGTNMLGSLTVTPPTHYEISTTSGSGYVSTPITVGSAGTITATTIYARLKSGLSAANYNNENIVVSSTGGVTVQNVSCSGTVSQKALTITGLTGVNKVYNGSPTASVSGTAAYNGLVNSESFIVSGTPAFTFANASVGNTKAITVTGYTAPSGNYSITQPTGLTADITAKPLTIGAASIASKVYDGSATSGTVTPGSLSGFVSGETVTVNTAVGTYPDTNVGTGKTATIVYTLANGTGGGLAANYSLVNGYANGTITAATLILNNAATTFNASNYSLPDLENSDLVVSAGEFVADRTTNTVRSITVAPASKLSLGANTLSITGDLLLKANASNSFSANIGDGTLSVTGAIKYLKTIDQSKWYFMAFPSDVTIAQITATNTTLGILGTDWFIKYYDGVKRGTSGGGANWISITADDVNATPALKLNKYQGYIFGLKNGNPDTELSFPLVKSELSTESTRSITVSANNAGASISATNHGWNLIGQPYLSKYDVSSATGAFNIYISDGTSTYTPYTKATVPMMNPMSAYFIQASTMLAGTGISFNTAGRQSVPSSVAIDLSDEVQLNLTSTTGTDYTLLTMDNNLSTDYEIGYDLEKWIGTGTDKPQVYSQLNGINYAFNALPMNSVNNLPIGIYTKNAGTTTISVNGTKAPSLSKLLLTDNGTSPATVTDLLISDYSFTATAGTDNTRFVLTAQRVPTANFIETGIGEPTVLINNSKLSISNLSGKASVRVYDAIGQTIVNRTLINSVLEIQLPAIGMYSVQVEANGKISTRKIINQN